ncbi:MAG: hypothetical protein QM808_05110 [Steroidobacteraceae bacterium]
MKFTNYLRPAWVLAAAGWGAQLSAATPDFTGVWQAVSPPSALKTVEGKLPPLLPEAAQLYQQRVAARKAGDIGFDDTAKCQPPGLPRAYFMGMPFEIQQEANTLYVLFQWNRLFRAVDIGISHDQQNMYAPTYFGFATGSWDKDALVIDSQLFNDMTLLDAAGLPHSMDMQVVERWALDKQGSTIQATFTIEDAQFYAAPWSFKATFKRMPSGTEIQEDVCLERMGAVKRLVR